MNNVEKLDELRLIAKQRGFTKDLQFYIPVRSREDGRVWIPGGAENALLWDAEWMKCLVGSEPIPTGLTDTTTIKELTYPKYEFCMIEMARKRAEQEDVIGWLYAEVKSHLKEER